MENGNAFTANTPEVFTEWAKAKNYNPLISNTATGDEWESKTRRFVIDFKRNGDEPESELDHSYFYLELF